jgi:hypothetical protein
MPFPLDSRHAVVVRGDDRIRRFNKDIALDPFIIQRRQTIGRNVGGLGVRFGGPWMNCWRHYI